MRLCTVDGALTRPSVNELNKWRQLELAMAAGVRERIGALQKEH